jgi:hypothetical protein
MTARQGKTAAETDRCGRVEDSFLLRKKGNGYAMTKYSIRTIIDG